LKKRSWSTHEAVIRAALFVFKCNAMNFHDQESPMAKGYWITFYRSVSNPDAVAAYAKLAGPAIQSGGGRFLVRGVPAKTYEAGMNMRTVVTEFDSVQQATKTFESDAYQAAARLLEGAAERDIRIVEGLA
jgi:uncharacterized protein (DUF1330 family)